MFFKQIEQEYANLNPELIKSVAQKLCKNALLASTSDTSSKSLRYTDLTELILSNPSLSRLVAATLLQLEVDHWTLFTANNPYDAKVFALYIST